VRNTFAETIYEAGKSDPRLVVVVADISPAGAMQKFRCEFPGRFVNTGVAEQVMIGMCAGMALRGLRPIAYTIATFALFRPFEFIRDDLCYQNLPVTVVGIGGGVTYSTLGATHHAMEDVAVACALPHMSVIAPCDPSETQAAANWCARQTRGPVYLRLGKAGEPDLSSGATEPWEFGKARYLKKGRDVCILGYGPILKLAFDVADRVEKAGRSCSILSVHTLKPLDENRIAEALATHTEVVVLEECVAHGGLGVQVQAIAWSRGAPCRLSTFSLKDTFIHQYGSHTDLLAAHGISEHAISTALGLD